MPCDIIFVPILAEAVADAVALPLALSLLVVADAVADPEIVVRAVEIAESRLLDCVEVPFSALI